MLEENVAGQPVSHLIRIDLLVYGPRERLSNLVPQIGHSLHSRILRIVRVDHTHEVIFGQCLELVEKFFHHLVIVALVAWERRKETRQTVNNDQS